MTTEDTTANVLLTGATGYVGGRLRRALEARGLRLRCLSRRPEFLSPRVAETTQVVRGDVMDPGTLKEALQGIDTAYYLVHSMESEGDFEETDRIAARNFAEAASACGVSRIIYLGGLGQGSQLSSHLKSRQEVGEILRQSKVSVIELRASIIIGSGSLSFEMIRSLVNKLPVMITPSWVRVQAQPIAIEDILAYLIEALDVEADGHQIYEIGGADRTSYQELLMEYARQRQLKRLIIPVPLLTLRISALWLGLITPIYARTGRKLIESVRNETIVTDQRALEVFSVRPKGVAEAISRALKNEDHSFAETRWSDPLSSKGFQTRYGGIRLGTRIVDSRSRRVDVDCKTAFEPIQRIGGKNGWYYGNWLWVIRGFQDILAGGVGLRRGRRHPSELAPGDTVDFWRVEAIEQDRLLRLYAEMKVPGRAWLQFEVRDGINGSSVVHQTAIFDPVGLPGLLYWYSLYPVHYFVFRGMLRNICRAAESTVRFAGARRLPT